MTSKCPWLSWVTCLIFHSHRTSNLAPATSFFPIVDRAASISVWAARLLFFYRQSRSCSLRAQTSRECRSRSCVSVGRSPHSTDRCHRLWRSGWPSGSRPDAPATWADWDSDRCPSARGAQVSVLRSGRPFYRALRCGGILPPLKREAECYNPDACCAILVIGVFIPNSAASVFSSALHALHWFPKVKIRKCSWRQKIFIKIFWDGKKATRLLNWVAVRCALIVAFSCIPQTVRAGGPKGGQLPKGWQENRCEVRCMRPHYCRERRKSLSKRQRLRDRFFATCFKEVSSFSRISSAFNACVLSFSLQNNSQY